MTATNLLNRSVREQKPQARFGTSAQARQHQLVGSMYAPATAAEWPWNPSIDTAPAWPSQRRT